MPDKYSSARNLSPTRWLNLLYLAVCSLVSARITRRELHFTRKKTPHACGPGWGKHNRKQNWPTECSLTSNTSFCHPRCCNQTPTRGCSLSALTKHQQMDNISAASPFSPVSGRQVRPQERFTKWISMLQICKFTGSYLEKLAAAKNVLFGTPLDVFCVYSNGFTSFKLFKRKDQKDVKDILDLRVFKWKRQHQCSCSSWLAGSETPASALPEQLWCFLMHVEHLFQWESTRKSPQISIP